MPAALRQQSAGQAGNQYLKSIQQSESVQEASDGSQGCQLVLTDQAHGVL